MQINLNVFGFNGFLLVLNEGYVSFYVCRVPQDCSSVTVGVYLRNPMVQPVTSGLHHSAPGACTDHHRDGRFV